MDADELMRLLNVAPSKSRNGSDSDVRIEQHGKKQREATQNWDEVSLHAVIQDKWDVARGKEVLERLPQADKENTTSEEVSDFFSVFFQMNPKLHEECQDSRRHSFLQAMMETPDYRSLFSMTMLNIYQSENACKQSLAAYKKVCQKIEREKPQKKIVSEREKQKQQTKEEMELLTAAGAVIEEATTKAEEVEGIMSGVGCGIGGGNNTGMSPDEVVALMQKIRSSHRLKAIFDAYGRYKMHARSKQKRKTCHGYEDMVGIHLDDNLEYILQEELVCLFEDELEMDTLRRLAEKETLATEYKGIERTGKGPVVICVDESASMDGNRIIQAKAFALTMAWIASFQKRWCMLVGYSSGDEGTCLVLKPGKWDQKKLLEWLGHFYDGGTDMDVPFDVLPNKWWKEYKCPKGQTEIVVITDGKVKLLPELEKSFTDWKKKEKVHCNTIIIGHRDGGDLERVSDELYCVEDMDANTKAVDACFSI